MTMTRNKKKAPEVGKLYRLVGLKNLRAALPTFISTNWNEGPGIKVGSVVMVTGFRAVGSPKDGKWIQSAAPDLVEVIHSGLVCTIWFIPLRTGEWFRFFEEA